MSDLKNYANDRKTHDPELAENYDNGYENFKIGATLKRARIEKSFTPEQLAKLLHTKKTTVSCIENDAEDIRLSTLEKHAKALDKEVKIVIE